MKKLFSLWSWEFKKNRTCLFLLVSGVFIMITCSLFVWFANYQEHSSTFDYPSLFENTNYSQKVLNAKEKYQQDPTIENYLDLCRLSSFSSLEEKFYSQGAKKNFYQFVLFSNYLKLMETLRIEGLEYYRETGKFPSESLFESEEKSLLEQAIVGDFQDFLNYEFYIQTLQLGEKQESYVTYLDSEQLEQENETLSYFKENLSLIEQLQKMEMMPKWLEELSIVFLTSSFPEKATPVSEDEFSLDFNLQTSYNDYHHYIETLEKNYQDSVEKRSIMKYQIENQIKPEVDVVTGVQSSSSYFLFLMPFGMIVVFFIFLGFFGGTIIEEHRKGLDSWTLTKHYTRREFLTSKLFYLQSVFIILLLIFLFSYFIGFSLLKGNLMDSIVLFYQEKVIEISYLRYILENFIRISLFYHLFSLVFSFLILLFQSLFASFLLTIIGVASSLFFYRSMLDMTYFGENWIFYLIMIVGISIVFVCFQQILYRKKWQVIK